MKKLTRLFYLTTILFVGLIMCSSCGTKEVETDDSVYADVAKSLGITGAKYEESLEKAVSSQGNNYLLKKVLEKLQAGEEKVYIAALGGSVTEGAGPKDSSGKELWQQGYAFQFKDKLTEEYAKDSSKVIFDGAGLSGTPSPLGLVRYEKDVVDTLGTDPDLLIIEFAVNDWQECSNTRGFEYLIRNALSKGTAVIALYAAATYGNQQWAMGPVAKFYDVPEVNVLDALNYSGINSNASSNIYYTDTVHPTKAGHTFMADCLMTLIHKIDTAAEDEAFEIPAGYKNDKAFTDFKTVYANTDDSNVVISAGSFSEKDNQTQGIKKGGTEFPENWCHSAATTSTENFKAELNCKSLIFVYMSENDSNAGTAEVYVDGNLKATYDSKGTWNNCITTMIIDEETSAAHTVEVKTDEGKKFTICALGYSE